MLGNSNNNEVSPAPKHNLTRTMKVALFAASILVLGQLAFITTSAPMPNATAFEGCEPQDDSNPTDGNRITLRDIGVLQLADHDLYRVDRQSGVDSEDEKLNLSTLFDHGDDNIKTGGESRNSENLLVHTIAMKLANKYNEMIQQENMDEDEARHNTVKLFLKQVKTAYENAFEQPFPPAAEEDEEDPEEKQNGNVALRTLHAFLPAEVKVDGDKVSLFDPSLLERKILSGSELAQDSRVLDDSYDKALSTIPVGGGQTIDLLERDQSFAEDFSTVDLDDMLCELADGHYDEGDDVMELLEEDFAAGQLVEDE
jgi:hypothetical protein